MWAVVGSAELNTFPRNETGTWGPTYLAREDIDDNGNSVPSQTRGRCHVDSNVFIPWGSGQPAGRGVKAVSSAWAPVWDRLLPSFAPPPPPR